eukprot:3259362-Prymnesium_polylepis.1
MSFLPERLPFAIHRTAGAQHAHSADVARSGGKWAGTHIALGDQLTAIAIRETCRSEKVIFSGRVGAPGRWRSCFQSCAAATTFVDGGRFELERALSRARAGDLDSWRRRSRRSSINRRASRRRRP